MHLWNMKVLVMEWTMHKVRPTELPATTSAARQTLQICAEQIYSL